MIWAWVVLALGLAGCVGRAPVPQERTVTWEGTVRIREDVEIPRGARLVVAPGTRVVFSFRDDDGDGWGDASIRVAGDLVVRGTPSAPVVFTPETPPPRPGMWGEIRVDYGTIRIRYAVIEGSTRGLHAHFSRGEVVDSVFRWNVDGTRLGNSELTVESNLFYGHPGKAYNAHRCRNLVRSNRFHHNRYGVFLFEADRGSVFRANWFRAHRTAFRLGDFFAGEVSTQGNDWGGATPSAPPDNPGARLHTEPAEVERSGPRGWPLWSPGPPSPKGCGTAPLSPPLLLPGGYTVHTGRPGWVELRDSVTGLERDAWPVGEGAVLRRCGPGIAAGKETILRIVVF